MNDLEIANHVLQFWAASPESRHWGAVDWMSVCVERPNLVLFGADMKNGGETYALIDILVLRIIDCGDEDDVDVERTHWRQIAVPRLQSHGQTPSGDCQ